MYLVWISPNLVICYWKYQKLLFIIIVEFKNSLKRKTKHPLDLSPVPTAQNTHLEPTKRIIKNVYEISYSLEDNLPQDNFSWVQKLYIRTP